MKVKILKKNGKADGWKIVAENKSDKLTLGTVRNLQFWGIDDTAIRYNGVVTEETVDGIYAIEMSWRQKKNHGS